MSSSQQNHRRRRQRRSAASAIAATTATAAVAYGTYRLAQWYWNEDEEYQEGTEHPLEEDLPSFSTENVGGDNENESKRPSDRRPNQSNKSSYSWLSTAAIGVANWLVDDSNAFPGTRGGMNGSAPRTKLTRRQNLIRCRSQSRIAFHTCFQTVKPVIESLTDSSRQTKNLKTLRKRKQALKQSVQAENGEEEKKGPDAMDGKQQERELRLLQEQEDELWSEILIETTTRMIASSYAYTLLLLSLTVQLHWLASNSEFQEGILMQSHRYFLNDGIPLLVSTVRRSIERVVFGDDEDDDNDSFGGNKSSSQWRNPSSQFVSSKDIEQTLYRHLPRVLDDLGMGNRQRRRSRRNWIRFVLPDEEVFDPIWDICRSPVWEDAQEQVLEYLWYKVLRDGEGSNNEYDSDSSFGWGKVFEVNGKMNGTDSIGNNEQTHLEHHQQQPLAKVMAHFKKAASALFEETLKNADDDEATEMRRETKSTLVGRLQTLPTVLELGDITLQ